MGGGGAVGHVTKVEAVVCFFLDVIFCGLFTSPLSGHLQVSTVTAHLILLCLLLRVWRREDGRRWSKTIDEGVGQKGKAQVGIWRSGEFIDAPKISRMSRPHVLDGVLIQLKDSCRCKTRHLLENCTVCICKQMKQEGKWTRSIQNWFMTEVYTGRSLL